MENIEKNRNHQAGLAALCFASYFFAEYLFLGTDLLAWCLRYLAIPLLALWIILSEVARREYKENQSDPQSFLAKPVREQIKEINKKYPLIA